VRSFWNLQRTDAGFNPSGRIVFEIGLPVQSYDKWDRITEWYAALLDRIRAVPGVTAAGAISSAPLGPELDTVVTFWHAIGGMPNPEDRPRARRRSVTPELFKAAGISMIAGRPFESTDRRDRPGVAIVDDVFVRQNFRDGNALGKRIVFRQARPPASNPISIVRPADAEIVGVVRSVRFAGIGADPEPTIYLPVEQVTRRQLIFVVSTELRDPAGLISGVRQAVRAGDPTLAVTYYDMGRLVRRALSRERMSMILLSLFGLCALALAAVGIYGIMAYSVAQRRGEFAVRAALGAEPDRIRGLVISQGRNLGIIGATIGLLIAAIAGRWMESQLFGISSFDPIVFVTMSVLMLAIVIGSTVIPALRAATVQASSVLRGE